MQESLIKRWWSNWEEGSPSEGLSFELVEAFDDIFTKWLRGMLPPQLKDRVELRTTRDFVAAVAYKGDSSRYLLERSTLEALVFRLFRESFAAEASISDQGAKIVEDVIVIASPDLSERQIQAAIDCLSSLYAALGGDELVEVGPNQPVAELVGV